MKTYEERIKTEIRISAYLKEVICDCCKKSFKNENWDVTGYDFEETEISYEYGSRYPEGGSSTKYFIDICPDCFEKRLIPLLEKEFDTKFQEEDIDW